MLVAVITRFPLTSLTAMPGVVPPLFEVFSKSAEKKSVLYEMAYKADKLSSDPSLLTQTCNIPAVGFSIVPSCTVPLAATTVVGPFIDASVIDHWKLLPR